MSRYSVRTGEVVDIQPGGSPVPGFGVGWSELGLETVTPRSRDFAARPPADVVRRLDRMKINGTATSSNTSAMM
jgi:hypothetical protein